MDGNLVTFLLLTLFGFVLPIVFAGIWTTHKKEMADAASQLDDSEKRALQAQLKHVTERLQVLEAIVTDQKYQLNQEIAELKVVKK